MMTAMPMPTMTGTMPMMNGMTTMAGMGGMMPMMNGMTMMPGMGGMMPMMNGMTMMPGMGGTMPMMNGMTMMPMMMPTPCCAMTCEMTADGMTCKFTPAAGMTMEAMKAICDRMTAMMAMGMPMMVTCNGMPMMMAMTA
jgi:hypothetical protein